jgi:hypothetical protein
MEMFNILHPALNQEIIEIVESAENEMSASGKFVYDDGSIVTPVQGMNMSQILPVHEGEQIELGTTAFADYRDSFTSMEDFHNEITRGVPLKRIGNVSLEGILAVVSALFEAAKGDFYGVMVADGNKRYNILHPITAMMIATGEIRLSGLLTAVIYRYSEKRSVDVDSSNVYAKEIQDITAKVLVNKVVPSISLSLRGSIADIVRSVALEESYIVNFREGSNNSNDIIIPVQLATQGLTMPWYGLIHAHKNGGHLSKNIFPALSGNISSKFREDASNTCTGNHDSNLYSSLYVLNNMNIASMYYGATVPPDIQNFVDACHEVSISALNVFIGATK